MDHHDLQLDPALQGEAATVIEAEVEAEVEAEAEAEAGQPEAKASSVHGNRYPLALRIQCLTLTSEGYKVDEIAAKLGMSRKTIYYIKKRARDRGFDPAKDPRILERYVVDGTRPGRPRKIPKPPVDGVPTEPPQDGGQALQLQEAPMMDMEHQA